MALIKLVELQKLSIGPEIREVLSETLDIPANVSLQRGWSNEIMSTIIELIWTDTDTVTQGIGATPTQLTPIAIARYLCAISNGGKVYDANIIDKVVDANGNIVMQSEPTLVEDLQLPEAYSKALWKGWNRSFPGKTGERRGLLLQDLNIRIFWPENWYSSYFNIDLEDNIWFCLVAPKDDPEIAVVIFVPNGLSDCKVYDTAKAIITYYFDQKEEQLEFPTAKEIYSIKIHCMIF